jgi:hypothetical protein
MATVTGYTAARMQAIEDGTVVDGDIVGDDLILTKHNGATVNAGNVRGAQGPQGVPGAITVSPAGGALAGNYPNPSLADQAVTGAKVNDALKDAAAATASMRTLGTGATQAAAGNHNHSDTGWQDIDPAAAGEAPFGTRVPVYLQYRKWGPMVHIRFRKDSAALIDRSTSSGGNFPNVNIFPAGTIPATARPDTYNVNGPGRFTDSPQGLVLTTDGAIVWVGGFPRSYPSGSAMQGNFHFMK